MTQESYLKEAIVEWQNSWWWCLFGSVFAGRRVHPNLVKLTYSFQKIWMMYDKFPLKRWSRKGKNHHQNVWGHFGPKNLAEIHFLKTWRKKKKDSNGVGFKPFSPSFPSFLGVKTGKASLDIQPWEGFRVGSLGEAKKVGCFGGRLCFLRIVSLTAMNLSDCLVGDVFLRTLPYCWWFRNLAPPGMYKTL